MKQIFIVLCFCIVAIVPAAAAIFTNTPYSVCFTPGGQCTDQVVVAISAAKQNILVQAYSFTSAPIAHALIAAKGRGVAIRVLLDKSQRRERYSSFKMLQNQGIPVWIDSKVAIAHNKVMIIDDETVITGSFNFTKAAQFKNAENLLIIHDKGLAAAYAANWQRRFNAISMVNGEI
jgi:phosphatidylserine/phosphatidylglycerophosphate/cardiolipin synthase-like enzyme